MTPVEQGGSREVHARGSEGVFWGHWGSCKTGQWKVVESGPNEGMRCWGGRPCRERRAVTKAGGPLIGERLRGPS